MQAAVVVDYLILLIITTFRLVGFLYSMTWGQESMGRELAGAGSHACLFLIGEGWVATG